MPGKAISLLLLDSALNILQPKFYESGLEEKVFYSEAA